MVVNNSRLWVDLLERIYPCTDLHNSCRDVLAMSLLKAGGAAIWGAADILNVRFSELPEMQSWGNAAFTLGLFFGSVGVACVVGPILFNYFTPPKWVNLDTIISLPATSRHSLFTRDMHLHTSSSRTLATHVKVIDWPNNFLHLLCFGFLAKIFVICLKKAKKVFCKSLHYGYTFQFAGKLITLMRRQIRNVSYIRH